MPTKFDILALLSVWAALLLAQQTDPHALYEGNCANCHEAHAGDFVFDNTRLSESTIVGIRSGRTVANFLEAGHGGLSSAEVELRVDIRTVGQGWGDGAPIHGIGNGCVSR